MVVLGEKLRQVLRVTQPGREVLSGSLFLWSNEFVQLCWVSVIGCHVQGLFVRSVQVAYVDWHKKCTCHVYQVSHAGLSGSSTLGIAGHRLHPNILDMTGFV
jgi:hypothetical protein